MNKDSVLRSVLANHGRTHGYVVHVSDAECRVY